MPPSLSAINTQLQREQRCLRERYGVISLAIAGSVARREAHEHSDVDLIVEFDHAPDLWTHIELQEHLRKVLHCKVDVARKQALRPEVWAEIEPDVIPVLPCDRAKEGGSSPFIF
jgi:predicted nucleotidyltransferase